jgi:hypothetical protein
MLRTIVIVVAVGAGCSATVRLEGGVRSIDGARAVRIGASLGLGFSKSQARRSVTVSGGYRYSRNSSATMTVRGLSALGPIYASGQFEVDRDGFDVAPALLVPVRRKIDEHPDSGIIPGSGAHLRTVTDIEVISIGLQPRVGRHDDATSYGVDVVLGIDSLSWTRE